MFSTVLVVSQISSLLTGISRMISPNGASPVTRPIMKWPLVHASCMKQNKINIFLEVFICITHNTESVRVLENLQSSVKLLYSSKNMKCKADSKEN